MKQILRCTVVGVFSIILILILNYYKIKNSNIREGCMYQVFLRYIYYL